MGFSLGEVLKSGARVRAAPAWRARGAERIVPLKSRPQIFVKKITSAFDLATLKIVCSGNLFFPYCEIVIPHYHLSVLSLS